MQQKKPLFVVCQKYKMFANISDVLLLCFHELGHYCNYLTRKKRNSDLLSMIAKYLSEEIILAYRDTKETDHFLNRSETIQQGRIKHFRVLNLYLEKELLGYLNKQVNDAHIQNAPEELFLYYVIYKSEALFSPKKRPEIAYKGGLINPLHYILDKIYGIGIGIEELKLPPLAIIHPYHSERIKAQQGVFTIFPNLILKHENLEDIADMRKNDSTLKHLNRIIIQSPGKVSEELKTLGTHRSWLYPEEPIVSQEIESGL